MPSKNPALVIAGLLVVAAAGCGDDGDPAPATTIVDTMTSEEMTSEEMTSEEMTSEEMTSEDTTGG